MPDHSFVHRMRFVPSYWVDLVTSPKAERLSLVVFWLAAAYAALGGVALRLWAPIILKHDNAFFLPLVFAMRNGMGFNNPWVSPTGSDVFDWHGIVHPVLLSWVAPVSGWAGVNAAVVLVGAVGMAAHLILIWRSGAPAILKAICAVTIPALYMGFSGRPESTTSLLMVALIVVNSWPGGKAPFCWWRLIISGAILGVLGATHPIAALISCVVYCAYVASACARAERSAVDYVVFVSLTGVVAIGLFALTVLALYPYGVENWISGMIKAGALAAGRIGEGNFLKYFLATKHTPFLVLTFLPFVYLIFLKWRELWPVTGLFYKLVLGFASVLLLFLIARFPIGVPASYYNYTVLLPALAVLACQTVTRDDLRTWFGAVTALSLSAFAGICVLAQALWVYQSMAGAGVRKAQAQDISALVSTHVTEGLKVAMDSPLLAAVDDVEMAASVEVLYFGRREHGGKEQPSPEAFDVVFRAQAEFAAPPDLPGFSMVDNAYLKGFGATPFSQPEHLGYAVYHSDAGLAGEGKREP